MEIKQNGNIASILWYFFLAVFAGLLIVILLLCIPDTQNNLPAGKMLVFPFCWLLVMICLYTCGKHIEGILIKYSHVLLFGFLTLYGIMLYFISIQSRAIPDNDHLNLYQGALYMAGLSNEMNWEYFARWTNNTVPMLILSVILRTGKAMGFQDPYYFAVIFNVIQVLCVLYCIFQIGLHYGKHKMTSAWLGTGMMAICLPILGHTQSLYTDAMSLSMGILGFYIWSMADAAEHRGGKYWGKNIIAGIIWGLGMSIKATAAIPMVAVFLYLILFRKKKDIIKFLSVLVSAVIIVVGTKMYTTDLPSEQLRDTYGTPTVTYFVGIGLKGNGGYTDNQEFMTALLSIYGMENKAEYSKQYIVNNAYEFINPEHIAAKAKYNFANGGLGASDFMRQTDNPNFIYECVSTFGKYFWRYCMINTSYFYYLLIMTAVTCIAGIVNRKNEEPNVYTCVPLLSIFGIMLYVMLFEANNRQLYNHLPWILLAGLMGMVHICSWVDNIKKKGRKK